MRDPYRDDPVADMEDFFATQEETDLMLLLNGVIPERDEWEEI